MALLTRFGVRDHASSHSAGYLTDHHRDAGAGLDNHQRTLVLGGRLRQPCAQMSATLVLRAKDGALHGIPVGMHVERTHENADLQPFVVEMVVLVRRLDDYHLAVAGRDDEVGVVYLQHANRVAEEISDEHQQRCRQYKRHSENPVGLPHEDRHVDDEQQEAHDADDAAPFLMNLRSFIMSFSGHACASIFSNGILLMASAAWSSAPCNLLPTIILNIIGRSTFTVSFRREACSSTAFI